VTSHGVELLVDDPDHGLDAVALWYHLRRPYPDRSFTRTDRGWRFWLDRPEVDRLEYLLDVRAGDRSALVVDPDNPLRASGPFGEHSVVEFPGYQAPWWLAASPGPASGRRRRWALPGGRSTSGDLGSPSPELPVEVWSPAGLADDEEAPLLLVHDGPQTDEFASLTTYSAALIASGVLPAHRVALLAPLQRDAWYSASPGYARSLATAAVPALLAAVPTRGRPVLAGVSLGALAAFHAEWTHPGTVDGLFLASGSFFHPDLDELESGFRPFWRITRAVASVLDAAQAPSHPPVQLVCGRVEENAANNRSFTRALLRLGYPAALDEYRDGHTWVGWRDTFDPFLTSLLVRAWGSGGRH
jgi:enterochelin esterase family protein